MGKYIEKGKRKVDAAEEDMEVWTSPLGVRTRAKTKSLALRRLQKAKSKTKSLALRRLQKAKSKSKSESKSAKSSPSSAASSSSAKSESCYLQLRSRRLEKSFATKPPKAASPKASPKEEKENDAGIEVSFGENVLEADGAGSRNSRETTPCSLIKRDSETIGTPGSTNRPTSSTANIRRIQSSTPRNIPYTHEMEEFFAEPEERQQKEFALKYNFDPAKDSPLPGRYEWVKLKN